MGELGEDGLFRNKVWTKDSRKGDQSHSIHHHPAVIIIIMYYLLLLLLLCIIINYYY